jgi:HEAT repeat protein
MPTEEPPDAIYLLHSAAAIEDRDSDQRWDIIRLLHARTDRKSFDTAAAFAQSADEAEQETGVDVLGQIGYKTNRPYLDETLPILMAACENSSSAVTSSAIFAIGHLWDPRGLATVLAHAADPDADIRYAVAVALPGAAGDPPAAEAITALIKLSGDRDPDIRDWATCGLARQIDADSEDIRIALVARLGDHDGDRETAAEALAGLARRRDKRALPSLLTWLDHAPNDLVIEAAAALADPSALPTLLQLKQQGWDSSDPPPTLLDAAISACTEQQPHLL